MTEPQAQTVLTYIPPTSPRADFVPHVVTAVRVIRKRTGCDLGKALAMIQPVRGQEGRIVVFTGSLPEADSFARDLVSAGCKAHSCILPLLTTYTPDIHLAHVVADQLKALKDQYAHQLGGNEQAAFRTVIDTLEEIGDGEEDRDE